MNRIPGRNRVTVIVLTVLLLVLFMGCIKQNREREKPLSIRFAVTGNTYPDSPFSFSFDLLDQVIKAINSENPLLVFHTGNLVHGGMAWMGINKRDMERQYHELKKSLGALGSIFYPVMGPKDLYNGSRDLFSAFSGRPESYIVKYGNLAFIVLDRQHNTGPVTAGELALLKEKLDTSSSASAVFIFTHAPWFKAPSRWSRNRKAVVPDALHVLLKKYPVRGVFCGTPDYFHETTREGILYGVTGCGGFQIDDRYKKRNQYYIVDFDGKECTIAAKQVKLEYKQR